MRIHHKKRADDSGVRDAKLYNLGAKHGADVMPCFFQQAFL
jgi:hypothetical protein